MTRSIEIAITNWSDVTLTFQNAQTQMGPAAAANIPVIGWGETMIVSATNDAYVNGGNQGTFELVGQDIEAQTAITYAFAYVHPQLKGATTVTLQNATPGFIAGFSEPVYAGDPASATVNLYQGVPVPVQEGDRPNAFGYAVPLAAAPYGQFNNCQDFANAMFGPDMRAFGTLMAGYEQPFPPTDFTGGQFDQIVDTLYGAWTAQGGTGETYNGNYGGGDKPILDFLAHYIAPAPGKPTMKLWVPELAYEGTRELTPLYHLSGYTGVDLAAWEEGQVQWNEQGIKNFLGLLVGGAHFVAVSATDDFTNQGLRNNSRDLYRAFRESGLSQNADPANSHYVGLSKVNLTGEYYLNINDDYAPQTCGLILALLFGRTVNALTGQYNTFMQLEGWPTVVTISKLPRNTRHMKDFATHEISLLNISTYGACAYSEKRAASVFLAPEGWLPQVYQTTRMMPYVGAYATGTYPNGNPQAWLKTDLVTIGDEAPVLPKRYYR